MILAYVSLYAYDFLPLCRRRLCLYVVVRQLRLFVAARPRLCLALRAARRVHAGASSSAPGPRLGATVVTARNLAKRYGELELFANLSFELPAGAVMGVVGRNGVGKTSLLNALSGRTPLGGVVRGDVRVNGETRDAVFAREKAAAATPVTIVGCVPSSLR